jgi:hypothetical protein
MIFSENRTPLFRIMLLTALAGAHDFDAIARPQWRLRPGRARHDGAVERDRDAALPVSTAFSASSASSVAPVKRLARAPFTWITASLIGCSKNPKRSFGRPRRQKTLEAERFDRRIDHIVEH